jgi:hypothetical protein
MTPIAIHRPIVYRPHRRSKPISATVSTERARHLAVAHARIVEGLTVRQAMGRWKKSRRTIQYWTNQALIYPEGAYLLARRRAAG